MFTQEFLKSIGAAGIGALVGTSGRSPDVDAKTVEPNRIPTRPFGKNGDKISILALGGDGTTANRLMMHQAVKWGVTFWDVWYGIQIALWVAGLARKVLVNILSSIQMTEKKYF